MTGRIAFVALASAILSFVVQGQAAPTATVKNGTYNGLYSATYNQDLFLGIPFAQPPTGDLRFQVPKSLNTTWCGARNATSYGYFCPGYAGNAENYVPSEDCLTINVVRPTGYENQSLPVATWIYGGGFFNGGSADAKFNLTFMVANSVRIGKPIIGVSLNYRVAGWGFMKSTDLVAEGSTNMGMRDQRLALHWLQENIAAFGGDPTKVTIWGESAGAYSVGYHLVAYGGRDDGLFRAAVAESGNPLALGRPTWDVSQEYYDNVTTAVGCSNASDVLSCVRAVPFETLDTVFTSTWANIFFPQPDGDFIEESTYTQLLNGDFVKVPLLIGANTDEGTAFVPRPVNTDEDLIKYIRTKGPDNSTIEDILKLYPDIPAIGIPSSVVTRPDPTPLGVQYKRACAFDGDYYFIAGRRMTAAQWAVYNATAYSYRFNTAPYTGEADFTAVTHFSEVPYVFDGRTNDVYFSKYFEGKPAAYYELAEQMSRMWIAFVTDLDPNAHGIAGQPQWPVYVAEDGYGENFVFDANVTNYIEPDTFRAEAISYLNSVWGEQFRY